MLTFQMIFICSFYALSQQQQQQSQHGGSNSAILPSLQMGFEYNSALDLPNFCNTGKKKRFSTSFDSLMKHFIHPFRATSSTKFTKFHKWHLNVIGTVIQQYNPFTLSIFNASQSTFGWCNTTTFGANIR